MAASSDERTAMTRNALDWFEIPVANSEGNRVGLHSPAA